MKRNKFLILLLVISLYIPVGNVMSVEKEDQEIKIGAILPLVDHLRNMGNGFRKA